jgi:nitrogen fixation protein FixH
MTELSPPAQAVAAQKGAPQQIVVTGHDFATTVRVRLEVAPGTPGPNTFAADISDYDTGQPVPARKVTLRFALPDRPDIGTSELELERQADGRWTGQGTNLSVTGTWRVGVLIEQAANSLEVPLEVQTRAPPQTITIIPGNPPIYRIDLPSGESVQAYVDPGTPGANELHFTYFTAAGGELPIADVTMSATSPSGTREEPKPRRLSRGHFVASVQLDPGTWTFSADATAEDGTPLSVHFEQEIK